jgi:hypothetical protein
MTDLSPAAQAVLDAAFDPWQSTDTPVSIAAAVLRAAADHCHSQEIREADHTTRRWICVDDLLATASELEAQ